MDDDWLTGYLGLTPAQAQERAREEGRACRVLSPGTAMTMDHRPDRLTIRLDEHGQLLGLTAA